MQEEDSFDEYNSTSYDVCVSMVADVFNGNEDADDIGTVSTLQMGANWNIPRSSSSMLFSPGWGNFGISPIMLVL